jgi:uncharacterized protein YggU (UPF0235/DUF167 family)
VFHVESNSVRFWLKVKPRASRERLRMDSSGELRLEVHAAPTEGQANAACTRFLARALDLPQSSVTIISGGKSTRKLLRISGHSGAEIAAKLTAIAGK